MRRTIATTSRLLNIKKGMGLCVYRKPGAIRGASSILFKEAGNNGGRLREEIAAGVPNLKDTAVIAAVPRILPARW